MKTPYPFPVMKIPIIAVRLSIFAMLLLGAFHPVAAQVSGSPDRFADLEAAVEKAIEEGKMPGAVVLIGNGEKTLYRKAFGRRSLTPSEEPMTAGTVFDLASLTKPIATATSVMILVERGRISLDDRVGKFIPEIREERAKRVTIRQLLTHVSGYRPDFDLGEKWQGREGMLDALYRERLRNDPGTAFVYSDIGFIVLGEIVERVSGVPLDRFAAGLFEKLGMTSTGFNPIGKLPLPARTAPGRAEKNIAPTERYGGQQSYLGSSFQGPEDQGNRILRGEVHDPTAYRMGGVAGHAGLFSNADDLATYCRMMLDDGRHKGKRVLSSYTIARMISPVVVSGSGNARGLGWDMDTSFSSNRGSLFPLGSFGHTGFTGTGIWMDPLSGTFVIFLSNRVHPDGKGDIAQIRAAVSTIAASAVPSVSAQRTAAFEGEYAAVVARQIPKFRAELEAAGRSPRRVPETVRVLNGIDVLAAERFKRLDGLKVGLVTNHTGRALDGRTTIDILAGAANVELVALFSPEHGIRGELDREGIGDSMDEKTGLPIYSLYGETRRPRQEHLRDLDAVLFDIQDIGTRFYTYISTLRYVMEEAAAAGIPVFVLDRPNPINGIAVEGSLAEESLLSFTAAHTVPVRHGMTVGELALMMNTERRIGADLRVVGMQGWKRTMWFDETGQTWVNPSPNMRSLTQATLYPGIGLLETTNLSVGRGTDTPFEVVGAPWMDGPAVAAELNKVGVQGARFVPIQFTPQSSKFEGERCSGINVIITDREGFKPVRTGTIIALVLRALHPGDWRSADYARLLASPRIHDRIVDAEPLTKFESDWSDSIKKFESRRTQFFLYK